MSYMCDDCGNTVKLIPTKNGRYLCRSCMVKNNLRHKIDFCCKCMTITDHDLYEHRGKRKSELYNQCRRCRTKTDVKTIPDE